MMAKVPGFLPPIGRPPLEFLAPGFNSWPSPNSCRHLENQSKDGNLPLSLPFKYLSSFLKKEHANLHKNLQVVIFGFIF